jgi:hypothetical protein
LWYNGEQSITEENYVMPKLDKQYLTLGEFLVLPIELPANDEPQSINTSIRGLMRDRKIDLLTQIKGSFQPLADMKKDLVDTFKPYRSDWYAERDVKQPLAGLFNFFKGIGYILGSLLLFIALPIYSIPQKNRPEGVGYFFALGGRYVCALSWFIDGVLSVVRSATQLVTTPLTWWIKIPLRKGITSFVSKKDDLLIENRETIQKIVNGANLLNDNLEICDKNKDKKIIRHIEEECYPVLENMVREKYTKAIKRGEVTHLDYSALTKPTESGNTEPFVYLKLLCWTPYVKGVTQTDPDTETTLGKGMHPTQQV